MSKGFRIFISTLIPLTVLSASVQAQRTEALSKSQSKMVSKKLAVNQTEPTPSASSPAAGKEKSALNLLESDEKLLKALEERYSETPLIAMNLQKTVKLALLGREKTVKGQLHLGKGRLRMELEPPEKSLVIADGEDLWVVTYPPKGFEDMSTVEVLKASLSSDKAKAHGLIQLLTKGGLFEHFRVTGRQVDGEEITFFLSPLKTNADFQRAQIWVHPRRGLIQKIKYWDHLNNETTYAFDDIKKSDSVDPKLFAYTPPKNVKVTIIQ